MLLKVKRFSEGFFLRERSRHNHLINEGDSHVDFHDLIRSSSYYSRLPSLKIECVELDGIADTLPILIEEIYSTVDDKTSHHHHHQHPISTKSKTSSDHPFVQAVQNFSKNLIKGISSSQLLDLIRSKCFL